MFFAREVTPNWPLLPREALYYASTGEMQIAPKKARYLINLMLICHKYIDNLIRAFIE